MFFPSAEGNARTNGAEVLEAVEVAETEVTDETEAS